MSTPSNGDKPVDKGPDPRRRKRRRRKNRGGQELSAVADEVRADNAYDKSTDTPKKWGRGRKDGSVEPVGNGQANKVFGDSQPERVTSSADTSHGKSKKRRRYPFKGRTRRGNESTSNPEMRNIRSAPRRTPDAAFNPELSVQQSANGGQQKKQKRKPKNSSGERRLYAALDLGTNNCRLLMALPQERGRFRVVDGFSRIVRLGEGLSQTGKLSDAAMDRAVDALKICAVKLKNRGIRRQRLIATEACRQAANGEAFLHRVKSETGLDLEIVDRETEARLAAEGCGSLMDHKSDGAVLFDIGGGSSELILVDSTGGRKRKVGDRIVAWTSLPMGVVTLAERFGGQDVSRSLFEDMVADVMTHIDAFEGREALKKVFEGGKVHLLGTSGTVTTLAGIHLKLPKYDRRQVDGLWLRDEDVDIVINNLLDMSYEKRAQNPCIGKERADLVLAGCAILNAIRIAWPTKRLRVADRGLREGMLAEMINSDGAWIKRRKDRWRGSKRQNVNHSAPRQDGNKS